MFNSAIKKIKNSSYTLPFLSFIFGFFLFCFYQQWIIIYMPFNKRHVLNTTHSNTHIKKIFLYFWKQNKWNKEAVDIMWSTNNAETLKHLTNRWFALLDEEELLNEKVSVKSITIAPTTGTAFISFDRYPFNEQSSVSQKLMVLEGLLKTVRESELKTAHIYFLVHHKPVPDHHLDFSHPWPVQGFLD